MHVSLEAGLKDSGATPPCHGGASGVGGTSLDGRFRAALRDLSAGQEARPCCAHLSGLRFLKRLKPLYRHQPGGRGVDVSPWDTPGLCPCGGCGRLAPASQPCALPCHSYPQQEARVSLESRGPPVALSPGGALGLPYRPTENPAPASWGGRQSRSPPLATVASKGAGTLQES